MKKQPKPIVVIDGEDFQVIYYRNEGHRLYVRGEYCGTFDRITDAQAERDRIIFEQLKRAA